MSTIISDLLVAIGHQQRGAPSLAEAIYTNVLEREPGQANALYLYGLLQLKDGRAAGAARLLAEAAAVRPDGEVRLHLARARLGIGDATGALAAAEAALAAGGDPVEGRFLRGTALNALGRPDAALDTLLDVAEMAPGRADIRLNLGNAHADLDQLAAAEARIREAIALDAGLIEAHTSLGFVLCSQGRYAEAMAACLAALALDERCAEAHWNLATALLLTGDFEAGFAEYEWHKRHRSYRGYYRDLPGEVWTGGPLEGRTVLVDADQGLGDTIQLARFMPVLAARGATVMLACRPELVPFLSGQAGLARVVARTDALPAYDCWVDQMSLPRLLGLRPDAIPGANGYLAADPARQEAWAATLPEAAAYGRVGLCWAGNPLHSNDARRSLPYCAMRQLVQPGMISLQKGRRANEADRLGLVDTSDRLHTFADTAALVATMDLVITVDTAVAHLAGALGVPVWVLLPHAPDWRWIAGRNDTPWYATMQLFRQAAPGDWAGVVERVTALLAMGL